ncbi:hypothetical protein KSF_086280 [Reticulibacter mediterranei]|uniref:Uncharacterized protein n=1 Tax=Reticulibacter mediterranei TaxID=2778369 RepID=A0A8J3IXF3_9CHLR|nr:hypothetical protein KSF_086280 [Reticulibacter mediterranei]
MGEWQVVLIALGTLSQIASLLPTYTSAHESLPQYTRECREILAFFALKSWNCKSLCGRNMNSETDVALKNATG